eukprot:scpid21031/ scgid26589/ Alpha-mannosidase 2; Golgi alpha-mannosidase II; Mannosidase alpha class 2A member 1; Mannosyl-oligosaccharide 1,3-1,6-alpha-mannosidase
MFNDLLSKLRTYPILLAWLKSAVLKRLALGLAVLFLTMTVAWNVWTPQRDTAPAAQLTLPGSLFGESTDTDEQEVKHSPGSNALERERQLHRVGSHGIRPALNAPHAASRAAQPVQHRRPVATAASRAPANQQRPTTVAPRLVRPSSETQHDGDNADHGEARERRRAAKPRRKADGSAADYYTADLLYGLLDQKPFDPGQNVPDYRHLYNVTQAIQKKAIEIIVIPHSHNDPGWLETFEDYYSGSTRSILDNVVLGLQTYPKWKFIWSEMSFLHRWWSDQGEETRDAVRGLVRSGRLELATGGWVMPDEANTHYHAVLDQLIEGHHWIRTNIDSKWQPKSSWSNDPFGYSSSVAHLYQQAGIKRLMILRTHYMLKRYLAQHHALQFRWRQPWDALHRSAVFTHLEPSSLYSTKHSCGISPESCCLFDFFYLKFCEGSDQCDCVVHKVTEKNIHHLATTLVDQARSKSMLFQTNTVSILNGDDFRYTSFTEVKDQYVNYDALMEYINSHPEFHASIKFGTLGEFLEKAEQENSRFPHLHGDFFPYSDKYTAYWTGYFSSRPFHKAYARIVQSLLYATDSLFVWASARGRAPAGTFEQLTAARHQFNIFQHHDAVTGTSRAYVMADYLDRLRSAHRHLANASANLLSSLSGLPSLALVTSARYNAGRDAHTTVNASRPATVLVLNPLPRPVKRLISVFVSSPHVAVRDCSNQAVAFATSLLLKPEYVRGRLNSTAVESVRLTFEADLPALGYAVYSVVPVKLAKRVQGRPARDVISLHNASKDFRVPSFWPIQKVPKVPFDLVTDSFSAAFSAEGLLTTLTVDGKTIEMKIEFVVYRETEMEEQTGGAYIFQPTKEASPIGTPATFVRVESGLLCHYVTSHWRFVEHTVRLCNATSSLGPVQLSITNQVSMQWMNMPEVDIAMRITSSLHSADLLFTDLNSLQMAQRRRFRDMIAPNFYPFTSLAYIQDRTWRLSLHTQQPLGVSSLQAGRLEVILDRNTDMDDGRGPVGGTPECISRTQSSFELVLERQDSAATMEPTDLSLEAQLLAQHVLHPPQIFSSYPAKRPKLCSGGFLKTGMPCSIQIASLRPIGDPGTSKESAASAAALVLYRLPASVSLSRRTASQVCQRTGHVDGQQQNVPPLANLFDGVRVEQAANCSLTMLDTHGAIALDTPLALDHRQLQTLKLRFSQVDVH